MLAVTNGLTVQTPTPNTMNETPQSSSKRRPSSPLDCYSLQSSLKRVRLSRSPGEFRLQKDLANLGGWERIAPPQTHSHTLQPQPEYWRKGPARLVVEDSHRVILTLDNSSQIQQQQMQFQGQNQFHSAPPPSKFWIQVPRMYPHRPPAVARMENVSWMRHVVIQDAPPARAADEYNFEHNHTAGTTSDMDPSLQHMKHATDICEDGTVVFQWNPVMHLGNLLDFLMESKNRQPSVNTGVVNSINTASPNQTHSTNFNHNAAQVSPTMSRDCDDATMGTFSNVHFVEEHKMEDLGQSFRNRHQWKQQQQQQPHAQTQYGMSNPTKDNNIYFAPNRFDMGYGKYMDMLAPGAGPSSHQYQQHHYQNQHGGNAMDMN